MKKTSRAKKATKAKRTFYATGKRGERGVERKALHILMTKEEREKLVKLSFKKKMSAADVIRDLIEKAR